MKKSLDIRTSISLQPSTKARLVEIGKKNESYDILINKLIDHYHNFTITPPTIKNKKRSTEEQIGNGLWVSTNPITKGKKK